MSANLTARQDFSPSCPKGGTWWACGYGTYFVGCCARDPCEIACAQGNLYPGAFDPSKYGTFPDATCGTGSKFYTCTASGTFWGCCKTNACAQSGCPDGDLEAAILNRDDLRSAYHATGGSSTVSSTSTSTSSTSASASASTSVSPKPDNGTPVAAIAGGAAGGVFAAVAVVGAVVWWLCLRKKKKAKKEHDYEETRGDVLPGNAMGEIHQQHYHNNKNPESPPSYTSPNPNFTHTFYGPQSQNDPYSHSSHSPYAQTPLNPGDPYASPLAHNPHDTSATPIHTVAAHNYQPPQELPVSSPSESNTPVRFRTHKSMYSHARGPSELSGDEPRNELDSSHPASPELSGSSPGRKWSWDDNKEKLQHAEQQQLQQQQQQQQQQSHESGGGVATGKPGRSPPLPRWQEARWEEQRIDERAEYADPRQRLLQAVQREREEEERGDSVSEEEEDNDAKRNVHQGERARSPQGLGLLDVLDERAATERARASRGDRSEERSGR